MCVCYFRIIFLLWNKATRIILQCYYSTLLHYYSTLFYNATTLQALHMREGLPVLTRVCSKLTSRTTSPALWSRAEEVPLVCHISSAQWPLSPVFPDLTYSHSFIHSCTFFKKIFIWLHRVLTVACRIFDLHCSMWDL